ncbi:MAG: class II fructose-bisphosphate aldolase, partial [Anaerolineae bacterium]|nr:class II fructose-bisphosphate aldolase [Anaerolineae bacterium]
LRAREYNVSVEAELGRIGTTDFVETDSDDELFTDPEEAALFVRETGVDALAVSVGTAHGVYRVRQPRIDYDRLRAIRAATGVHLVLHGGSGVPASMVKEAIRLGVSKVNIATELELAALGALGREGHLTDAEMGGFAGGDLARAQAAVGAVVRLKMQDFLGSWGQSAGPGAEDE